MMPVERTAKKSGRTYTMLSEEEGQVMQLLDLVTELLIDLAMWEIPSPFTQAETHFIDEIYTRLTTPAACHTTFTGKELSKIKVLSERAQSFPRP